ncbi:nsp1ab [Bovine astrovirus B76/HK]|uniref:nsp1ab n=1 Tax=Bovine astrovirus B76/HK TaxID=1027248 RepID=UPI00020CD909|nr:nsp1ab [Bovine astrovirus B76/HK]AED89608.1 nsp1ab [Bovine astrovirus B76/HK]
MSLYINRADEALASHDRAQLKPRFDAREWFDEMRRIAPTVPWYVVYKPRSYFYPTRTDVPEPQAVLTASTVCEGEWRTFIMDTQSGRPVMIEVNHILDHQPTILAAALIHDRAEKSKTISELRLDNELLRGQIAFMRQEYATTTPRFTMSWATLFALVFLGFSLFWHSAHGLTTTSTTDSVNPMEMLKLNIWLEDFISAAKKTIHTHHYTVVNAVKASPSWILATAVMPHLWQVVALVLGIVSVYRAEKRVISILFLAAATISGADWVFLASASLQTVPSALIQVACVIISHFDPIGAICVSALAMFGTFLASMCATNTTFVQHSRAASANTAILVLSIVLRTLGLPSMPIALALAIVRAYTILTTPLGATIEVRSEDGKVLSKDPLKPGILFRFKQGLKKFAQLRTSMPPLVRVNPTAVVRIETPEGIGSGFLCANYIVTAGHVVGQNKVVSICVGSAKYQAPVARQLDGKDVALLKIPQQMQGYPRLKIAQKVDPEWICVYSPDDDGAIVQSVVPGHQVDECLDYAVPTRNGMSGCPVVNPDGRVMGVHLTNTGFTGGAQIITQADVIDPPKVSTNEDKLRQEIDDLKKQLAKCSQSSSQGEVVELVRAAMAREMKILRAELNKEIYTQAKGKTKGKKRLRMVGAKTRRQRGPMFTEEEYQALLEKGMTPEEIRDMVERLYEKEAAGFPDWDPMDDGYDPDEDWAFESDLNFGQRRVVVSSFNQYLDRDYDAKAVEDMLRSLTHADVEAIGPLYPITAKCIGTPLCSAILCLVDRYAVSSGLSAPTQGLPYTQRRLPKNREAGPPTTAPEIHQLDSWESLRLPPSRRVVPDDYPVVCNLPINRPIYEDKLADDPLLGLLPPCDPELAFAPATWGPQAFTKSFEKFSYAEPSRFWELYPDECAFADLQWRKHYNFLEDTRVVHITATEKNVDSTPGYPKCELHDSERDYIERHGWAPYIREFKRVDSGERPRVLWYCFLKKEQLKKEKIADGDIRQIICPDVIYSRIGAALEQHQNKLMKQHTDESSGQCGWTPFFGGFARKMRRLDKNKVVEFDWTRFDGTIPRTLLKHIKNLRWEKINAEHRKRYQHVHDWYVQNLLHRYVLMPTGEVTIQMRGNPSGQISTTMDNNMVNYWLQAFEFAYLNKGKDIHALWDDYDTIVYGDDRLTSTPCIPDNYVERVVTMYKEVFGMWVKPEKVKVTDTVVGASFCGFTVGPDYQPIPANPEKLWASLVTPCQKLPDEFALYGKLLSFKILMHNSGDHPFKEYVEKCLAALEHGRSLPKITNEQLDRLWRGGPKTNPNG